MLTERRRTQVSTRRRSMPPAAGPGSLSIRPARSPSEKDRVYALRYRVYRAMGAIEPSAYQRLRDQHDAHTNSRCYLVELGGAPLGTIRISVRLGPDGRAAASERSVGLVGRELPCTARFRASIDRHVGPGACIVEGGHLLVDRLASDVREQVESTLITLLLANADAHEADWVVVTSPVEQAARLCRQYGMRRLSDPCRSRSLDLDQELIGSRASTMLARLPELKLPYFEALRLAV